MRAGVLISAVGHVVLVLLALLGTPKLFDENAVQSIMVDLVPPEEVEPPNVKPEPEKTKPPEWGLPADKAAPWPEAAPQAQARQAPTSQQPSPTPQTSDASLGSASRKPAPPSIFDPAAIPMLLDLPNAPERGFDSEATSVANLSADERTAFKAQLRKCWKLPGQVASQATRVVLRVYLRRDARLAGEPVLIEASASRDGPIVMHAAMRALKDCQPFSLPPDRYTEWKVLDLSFTPQEMAGG
jgi:hypothetical protein